MTLYRQLLPVLAVAAWAGFANAQVPDQRARTLGAPDTRPTAGAGEVTVSDVTITENRVGLVGPDPTRVEFLPTGVYTNEAGVQLVVQDGAIRELAGPRGSFGGTSRAAGDPLRTAPTQPAVERVAVRSTMLAADGSVRLQTAEGGSVAIPDGRYVAGGETQGIIIDYVNSRPSSFRLPGVEQGVHDQENQPSPVSSARPSSLQQPGAEQRIQDVNEQPNQVAMRGGTTGGSVLVARGPGGPARPGRADVGVAPPSLRPQDLSALLDSFDLAIWGGAGPWTVSPDALVAEGRAELTLWDPLSVNSSEATMEPDGSVWLDVRASLPNERYLIDCKVGPAPSAQVFGATNMRLTLTGTSGSTTANGGHLVAIYEATDSSWAYFIIKSEETLLHWNFYSCEITRLQQTP